jgi:DNA-binding response OmpR family regulator
VSSKILVIDDEANIRTMIKLALEHAGHQVETAADGPEGVKKAIAYQFDLVLIDQRMPGMSGMEVQKSIQDAKPDSKVIMITAFGTIDLALDAIHGGASDFLRKPFTADTLRTAVRTALERPAQKSMTVPIGLVCREFTRTTLNGFSFDIDPESHDGHGQSKDHDKTAHFLVRHADDRPVQVKVCLPGYVMELVKAYIDSDHVPGGEAFWQSLCEEALANYLWQNAEIPADKILRIEDLSNNLQRWLDAMMTVDLTESEKNQ